MTRALRLLLPLLAVAALAGCAAADRGAVAERLAAPAQLQRMDVAAGGFRIAAWRRIARPDLPLHVYIEGDGLAWLDRSTPSGDPTPRHPVGLALAAADPAPNVLYLARPCMYAAGDPACRSSVWTADRFSETAVAALDAALDRLKPAAGRLELIGYSGGAAIAVALAARRSDVVALRTVAGNLDPAAVNRYHAVSAQPSALDIAALAPRLARMPQRHFIGTDDTVVPAFVAEGFAAQVGPCAAVSRVAAGHELGWMEIWPALLRQPLPAC